MQEKISVSIPKDLLFKIKKSTDNISKFLQESAEEKIRQESENSNIFLDLVDSFPRKSIEENTLEILRRSRDEE